MMISHCSSAPKILLLPKQPRKPRHHGNRNPKLISASMNGPSSSSDGSRSVDESMVVLRERIQEIRAIERSYEAPEDWAEWEKEHHARYSACVCSFAGALQTILMSSRPSVAMAMMAMLAMSIPISAFTLTLTLIHTANEVFPFLHLG